MLYYVTRELHAYTIKRFLGSFRLAGMAPPTFVRGLTYETLLALKRALGHCSRTRSCAPHPTRTKS